eukprot:762683-Hanusia_phi.AAC.1
MIAETSFAKVKRHYSVILPLAYLLALSWPRICDTAQINVFPESIPVPSPSKAQPNIYGSNEQAYDDKQTGRLDDDFQFASHISSMESKPPSQDTDDQMVLGGRQLQFIDGEITQASLMKRQLHVTRNQLQQDMNKMRTHATENPAQATWNQMGYPYFPFNNPYFYPPNQAQCSRDLLACLLLMLSGRYDASQPIPVSTLRSATYHIIAGSFNEHQEFPRPISSSLDSACLFAQDDGAYNPMGGGYLRGPGMPTSMSGHGQRHLMEPSFYIESEPSEEFTERVRTLTTRGRPSLSRRTTPLQRATKNHLFDVPDIDELTPTADEFAIPLSTAFVTNARTGQSARSVRIDLVQELIYPTGSTRAVPYSRESGQRPQGSRLTELNSEELDKASGDDALEALRDLDRKKSAKDFDKIILEHFSNKGSTREESQEDSWLKELQESLDQVGKKPQKGAAKGRGAKGVTRSDEAKKPNQQTKEVKAKTSGGGRRSASTPRAASAPSLRPSTPRKSSTPADKPAKQAVTRGRKAAAGSEASVSSEGEGSASSSRTVLRRGRTTGARGRAGTSAGSRKATGVRGRKTTAGRGGGQGKGTSVRGRGTATSAGR